MLAVLVEAVAELVAVLVAVLGAVLDTVLVAALDEAEDGLAVEDVCAVLAEVAGGAEDPLVLDVVLVPMPVVGC